MILQFIVMGNSCVQVKVDSLLSSKSKRQKKINYRDSKNVVCHSNVFWGERKQEILDTHKKSHYC